MKKSIIAAFAGVLALAACQKEANVPVTATKTVSFHSAAVQTKTVFGEMNEDDEIPTLWSANDSVSVSYNLKDGKMSKPVTVKDNGLSSIFEVEITPDAEAQSHDFYIVSPAKALIGVSAATKALTINIPSSQTPVEGSCDEAAQVLYAEAVDNGEFPEEMLDVFYNHITAYGKISIVGAPAGVTSISLTASEDITGRFRYSVENYEFTPNAASKSLTINTTETQNVMFAVAPADLSGGSLKVVLGTEDGTTYTKNIDLSSQELAFNAAQISTFSVSFRGIQADAIVEYKLVKDVNSLHAGDHIIIAAKAANKAISTTQQSSNRAAADVAKADETITNPSDAVQIITLEDGSVANTAAFKAGNGYLYAASSSSNHLKTQASVDANASWKITVAADGTATIVAQGNFTRATMQYNSSSTIFSCYSGATQGAVEIYSDGAGTEELWSDSEVVEPEQPEEPAAIFAPANDALDRAFEWNDIVLPEGLTYIWKFDSQNKYLKASSYVKANLHGKSEAVTKEEIDLTNVSAADLTFKYAINYGTPAEYAQDFYLMIYEGQAATKVSLTGLPTAGSWTFYDATVSLNQFCGKKVKIAFVYDAVDATTDPTVEVKDIVVK